MTKHEVMNFWLFEFGLALAMVEVAVQMRRELQLLHLPVVKAV